MSDSAARAERYRLEAAEIRRAADIIQDERFRAQLLSIADDYDACAKTIEDEIARQSVGER
jgi:hypothetical protein